MIPSAVLQTSANGSPSAGSRRSEVIARIGSRPALIQMANISDYFGDAAPYRIEEGIGIIDISGPLSNAPWSWRGTTYGEIQEQMKIAMQDPNVRGILLNVNSPGGESDNSFETAAVIAAAAEKKPVYACAATMAYSAAYLLASQAEKIYCTPVSGGVGSIGVYCAHFDFSSFLEQSGIKVTLISAGDGKTLGNPYEPLSESDLDQLTVEIDRLYGEFVSAVARGRSMDSAAVVKLGARCYDGAPAALVARLADAPGDLSTAWVDLCSLIQRAEWQPLMRGRTISVASATNSQKEKEQMAGLNTGAETTQHTAADLEKMIATAKDEGYAGAAEVIDLCMIAGQPGKIAGFVAAKKSAADVRKELIAVRSGSEGAELNTTLMPGTDTGSKPSNQNGKARPWKEVLSALGLARK